MTLTSSSRGYAWPARRYRSALASIADQSAQGVVMVVLILPLVLAG